MDLKKLSVEMCYILRHNPTGYNINDFGFIDINEILEKLNIDLETLMTIVNKDNKNRYEFKNNMIRCRQGHSIDVILELEPQIPPEFLLHGTTQYSFNKILESKFIKKMTRNYVHLTDNLETAMQVAERRKNNPVVLVINTKIIKNIFYLSTNNVWLTDDIPHIAICKYYIPPYKIEMFI